MSNWGIRRAPYGLLASDIRKPEGFRSFTRSARFRASDQPRVLGFFSTFAPVLTTVALAGLVVSSSAISASAMGMISTTRAAQSTVSAVSAPSLASATMGVGSTTYIEETDPAIVYSGAWQLMSAVLDSGGSANYLDAPGSATLTFTGTDISWLSRESATAGIADVFIDNVKVASVDRYSATKTFGTAVFTKTGLTDGVHTIKIVWTGLKNAAATDTHLLIDAFVVSTVTPDPAPVPLDPALTPSAQAPVRTTWQENNSAIVYSGSWSTQSAYWDNGGSTRFATRAASAKLTFTGTDVQWISRQSTTSGISDVLIDGVKVASVDRYAAANAYGQVVFAKSGLSYGSHTIQIVWTGLKNGAASGSNILLDAFVTWTTPLPLTPVPPVATVQAAGEKGLNVVWNTPSTNPVGYSLTRSTDGVTYAEIAKLGPTATSYLDISITPGQTVRYKVTALDYKDSDIGTSTVVSSVAPAIATGTGKRFANCPTATMTVSTATELKSALWRAVPGSSIRLNPGTYVGTFGPSRSGSETAPIWVCGPRTAILTTGSISSGHAFSMENKSDIVLAGFTISTAFKGVTVVNGARISVVDLLVEKIGYEAIHLRNQTIDSEVSFNTIRNTGLVGAAFGEGVYLGTSDANWCSLNGCLPDRTTRVLVYGNTISATGAQAIEAKAGTSNGVIAANVITGSLASNDGWITVKGNGWLIADNSGTTSSTHGYATNASVAGWGKDNVFTRNAARNASGYNTWIHQPSTVADLGNMVSCLASSVNVTQGITNATCRK